MKHILIFLFTLHSLYSTAQINKPSLSPLIKTEQQVGLVTVHLEYGQPSKQGRTVFGKLIPYNRLWRTGANAATKISFTSDVFLNENLIPAGNYSLYSIPHNETWTIILNKNTQLWGSAGYKQEEDLLRFTVPVTTTKNTTETFQIFFEKFHENGGTMVLAWENTKIAIPVYVDSDKTILAEIAAKIDNPKSEVSAQTYFDAAQFYYLKNIQLDKAALWFDKAIALKPNAFWYVYYKAELAYHLDKLDVAKKNAQACLKAAKESTSSDYGYIAKATLLLEKIEG